MKLFPFIAEFGPRYSNRFALRMGCCNLFCSSQPPVSGHLFIISAQSPVKCLHLISKQCDQPGNVRKMKRVFWAAGSGKLVSFSLNMICFPGLGQRLYLFSDILLAWVLEQSVPQEKCNEEGNPALGCLPRKMEVLLWHG